MGLLFWMKSIWSIDRNTGAGRTGFFPEWPVDRLAPNLPTLEGRKNSIGTLLTPKMR